MGEFTPEQLQVLRDFADHYRLGRKVMCGFAHLVAALGALAAVVEAYFIVGGHHG